MNNTRPLWGGGQNKVVEGRRRSLSDYPGRGLRDGKAQYYLQKFVYFRCKMMSLRVFEKNIAYCQHFFGMQGILQGDISFRIAS